MMTSVRPIYSDFYSFGEHLIELVDISFEGVSAAKSVFVDAETDGAAQRIVVAITAYTQLA
jgi:hypothetical protein